MPYLELIDAFSVQDLLTNVNLIKTILQGHALWAIQLCFIDAKCLVMMIILITAQANNSNLFI